MGRLVEAARRFQVEVFSAINDEPNNYSSEAVHMLLEVANDLVRACERVEE